MYKVTLLVHLLREYFSCNFHQFATFLHSTLNIKLTMNNSKKKIEPRGESNNSSEEGPSWWSIGLGLAAGVATVAGGIYMINKLSEDQQQETTLEGTSEDLHYQSWSDIVVEDLSDVVSGLTISASSSVSNLNSLLNDIHVRYIAIKKEEFSRRYNVFTNVFKKMHYTMKAVDSYYKQYSSRVIYRPEDSKVYIVIRLPVNIHENLDPEESDIVIEPKHASFVQLRAGRHYENIISGHRQDGQVNRTAVKWLDDKHYILSSKFISWMQSVIDRALHKLDKSVTIDGIEYKLTTSFKQGSYTLWITNNFGFRFELVLVPALKFPEDRWLGRSKAYRDIPSDCNVDYWMVIPKPNKFGANSHDEDRSWHVDLHEQEKKFIHNSFHLRQGMRLLKKLRDTQQMHHIEDYHIETFFLWKCENFQKSFWQRDVATVFKVMLQEFYESLEEEKISFFWKRSHNLIEKVPGHILKGYANKLSTLSRGLEVDSNYMLAAEYLLTETEYAQYKGQLNRTQDSSMYPMCYSKSAF